MLSSVCDASIKDKKLNKKSLKKVVDRPCYSDLQAGHLLHDMAFRLSKQSFENEKNWSN